MFDRITKFFYPMKRVPLPGPGASEYVFERRFYDPAVDTIGPGYANAKQLFATDGPPVNVSVNLPVLPIIGIPAGEIITQPLQDPNGSNSGSMF